MKLIRQKYFSDDNGAIGTAAIAGVGGGLSYLGYRSALKNAQNETGITAVREQIANSSGLGKAAEGVSSSTAAATSESALFKQGLKDGTLKNSLGLEEGTLNSMRTKNSELISNVNSGRMTGQQAEKYVRGRNNILRGAAAKKFLLPGLAVTGLAAAGYLGYKQLTKNKKRDATT